MRDKELGHDRHHRGRGPKRKEHGEHKHGAKTFRRRRAIAFLELLNTKRSTLKKQLETPELQTINPILLGELKALDMVMDEFVQLFELHEAEGMEQEEKEEKGEAHDPSSNGEKEE